MSEENPQEDTESDEQFPQRFSSYRAVGASITSITLSVVLLMPLFVFVSNFPLDSLLLVEYERNFSYRVWAFIITASSLGVAISTTYWYYRRADSQIKAQLRSPLVFFLTTLITSLVVISLTGFLRLFVLILLLIGALLGILGTPIAALVNLVNKDGLGLYWSVALGAASYGTVWLAIISNNLEDSGVLEGPMVNTMIMVVIALLTMSLPEFIGKANYESNCDPQIMSQYDELDIYVRGLDYERLSNHGFEIPYRRAALSPASMDLPQSTVLSPDLGSGQVGDYIDYYHRVSAFESRLMAVEEVAHAPTPVTRHLSHLLMGYIPHTTDTAPDAAADVTAAGNELLETYCELLEENNDDIAALEERLTELESSALEAGDDRMSSKGVQTTLRELTEDF